MTGAEVLLNLVIGMTGSLIAAGIYEYARYRYQLYKRQHRFTLQLRASRSKEVFRAFLKKILDPRPMADGRSVIQAHDLNHAHYPFKKMLIVY